MDDSSGSGSDGEETPEDVANYKASLKKAESMAQKRQNRNYYLNQRMNYVQLGSSFIPDTSMSEDRFESK